MLRILRSVIEPFNPTVPHRVIWCGSLFSMTAKLEGRSGVVDRASDFGPRGPWFDSPPVHIALWPWASHIYPLLSTGLTQEVVDGRQTWTDCDEAGDYVVPNVLSPRDLVSRPDIMDETTTHNDSQKYICNI